MKESDNELVHKKKGRIGSIIFGIITVVILLFPFFTYPDPPPGQPGVMIDFGRKDEGSQRKRTVMEAPKIADIPEPAVEKIEEKPVEKPVEKVVEKPVEKPKPKKETKKTKKIITADNSEQIKIRKAKEKIDKAKRLKAAEDAAKAKAEKAEKEKIRRQKEAARKAREAKEAKASQLGNKLGGLFGNDEGSDNGNSNKPGDGGVLDGGQSDVFEGAVSGAGKVGAGLGDRGGQGPKINAKTGAQGIVVVEVCVDDNGRVISSKFTQGGSTTSNAKLRSLAEKNARKWKFSAGLRDEQCGTITYDFRLK